MIQKEIALRQVARIAKVVVEATRLLFMDERLYAIEVEYRMSLSLSITSENELTTFCLTRSHSLYCFALLCDCVVDIGLAIWEAAVQ